jgi:hypothetical protein
MIAGRAAMDRIWPIQANTIAAGGHCAQAMPSTDARGGRPLGVNTMRMTDIIENKRDGEVTRDEIEFFVDGYTRGDILIIGAAWCMASIFAAAARETADLTLAMARSGDMLISVSRRLSWTSIPAVAWATR